MPQRGWPHNAGHRGARALLDDRQDNLPGADAECWQERRRSLFASGP